MGQLREHHPNSHSANRSQRRMLGAVEVIGQREASREFGIPQKTISSWVHKGLIRVLQEAGRGQRQLLLRRDVEECARHYRAGRGRHRFAELQRAVLS